MKAATARRLALVAALAVLAGLVFALDLQRFLTLESLQASRRQLLDLYRAHPVFFLAAYVGTYIVVAALAIPGAVVMTLAGGAVLGFWVGTAAVSVASTVGATAACAVARYLLRDWVEARFGPRLERIQQGLAREGAFYLFTLRLIPAVPFFLLNAVMGLTRLPLTTYFWVSQLGMLPATLLYVNAGRELGAVRNPSDVLSPGLLLSLTLLGLFPLAARWILAWFRARRKDAQA